MKLGQPEPEVTWLKEGKEIKIKKKDKRIQTHWDMQTDEYTLEIQNATKDDIGEYTAVAKNEKGTITVVMTVMFKVKEDKKISMKTEVIEETVEVEEAKQAHSVVTTSETEVEKVKLETKAEKVSLEEEVSEEFSLKEKSKGSEEKPKEESEEEEKSEEESSEEISSSEASEPEEVVKPKEKEKAKSKEEVKEKKSEVKGPEITEEIVEPIKEGTVESAPKELPKEKEVDKEHISDSSEEDESTEEESSEEESEEDVGKKTVEMKAEIIDHEESTVITKKSLTKEEIKIKAESVETVDVAKVVTADEKSFTEVTGKVEGAPTFLMDPKPVYTTTGGTIRLSCKIAGKLLIIYACFLRNCGILVAFSRYNLSVMP